MKSVDEFAWDMENWQENRVLLIRARDAEWQARVNGRSGPRLQRRHPTRCQRGHCPGADQMMTAREFVDATNDMDDAQMVTAVETRDAEIRAEVLALECSAHKKELRGARAATLREAAGILDKQLHNHAASLLRDMVARAERGES